MRKLLIATCIISLSIATCSFAEEKTYTEQFIQKHTQKLVDVEKNVTAKQKAQLQKIEDAKKAQEKAKADQKAKLDAQKKAQEEFKAAQQKKLQEKKDALNTLKKW